MKDDTERFQEQVFQAKIALAVAVNACMENGIRADAVASALCSTAGNLVGLNMNPEGHETFLQMAIDAMRGDIKTGAALATAIDLEQGTVRPYSGIVTN